MTNLLAGKQNTDACAYDQSLKEILLCETSVQEVLSFTVSFVPGAKHLNNLTNKFAKKFE